MNLFAVRPQLDRVLNPVSAAVARLPIHANAWTALGAAVALAGAVALYAGAWGWGLTLLVARGFVDHIDGYKARNHGQRSTFGAIADDVADRWALGVLFTGGCLRLAGAFPHAMVLCGLGITGSLTNVIVKLSIYAEAQQDIFREEGKLGHPVDVVGPFGSAEFILYFGAGLLGTALTHDLRPALFGVFAVVVVSHVSLVQRLVFAWRRYRNVDPGARPSVPDPADPT